MIKLTLKARIDVIHIVVRITPPRDKNTSMSLWGSLKTPYDNN